MNRPFTGQGGRLQAMVEQTCNTGVAEPYKILVFILSYVIALEESSSDKNICDIYVNCSKGGGRMSLGSNRKLFLERWS